jgi:hypothetical protein
MSTGGGPASRGSCQARRDDVATPPPMPRPLTYKDVSRAESLRPRGRGLDVSTQGTPAAVTNPK